MKTKTTCILIFCVLHSIAYSQASPEYNSNAETLGFSSMISKLDLVAKNHLSNDALQTSTQKMALKSLFAQPLYPENQKTKIPNNKLALNDAKIDLLRKEYGLELKAGYLENIDAGIFGPGNIYYRRRAKLEVEWDLLKNGFFENRYKIKELRHEKATLRRKFDQKRSSEKYASLYNRIIYYFNKSRVQVIENYLALENAMLEATAKLYAAHYVPWNAVLEHIGQKARLENKRKAYRTYNAPFSEMELPAVNVFELPVVDVNLQKITPPRDSTHLQNPILDSLYLDYSPFRDVDLSVYARYNLFGGTGYEPLPVESFGGREYFSVGFDIGIPLFFNTKEKRTIKRLERKLESERWQNNLGTKNKEIYNHYYEYQFTLQQYIQFYTKYLNINELIRKQAVLPNSDPEYSPRKLTRILGVRYQIVIALIDLKQKLYLKLLKLGTYTPLPISEFVEPVELSAYFNERGRSPSPSTSTTASSSFDNLYIWSEGFYQYANPFLINFLKEHSITKVHLSFSGLQLEKAANFVEKAHQNQIKIYSLVGNNQLIFYENHLKKLENYFREANEMGMDGVHLDVEPQVFDDWDQRKTDYQELFVGLLKEANRLATDHQLQLSVSIPFYSDTILKEIKPYADAFFVMAYETNDIEKIKSRIAQEAAILGCKLVVSLRPSDFASVKKLKTALEKLELNLCQNSALHDLKAFIKLTENEK